MQEDEKTIINGREVRIRITSIELKKSENKSKITMRMLEAVTALKKISRRKYVLMTGNATTSLYLALKSLNLKPDQIL